MDSPLNLNRLLNSPINHTIDDTLETFDSLLKTFFYNITKRIMDERPGFVLSCFQDHPGYIKLDSKLAADFTSGQSIPVHEIHKATLQTTIKNWPTFDSAIQTEWSQKTRRDDQKFELDDQFSDALNALFKDLDHNKNSSTNKRQTGRIVASKSQLPQWGKTDPYAMGLACVDQCVRTLIGSGANPNRIALSCSLPLTNNNDPVGAIVEAIKGAAKAAEAYNTPFISIDQASTDEPLSIRGIGILDQSNNRTSTQLNNTETILAIMGMTGNPLGGSALAAKVGLQESYVPNTKPKRNQDLYNNLYDSIKCGWIRSTHDIATGGLAVALKKMAYDSGIGIDVNIDKLPIDEDSSVTSMLFAETPGRLILAIDPRHFTMVEAVFGGQPFAKIGTTTSEVHQLSIGLGNRILI